MPVVHSDLFCVERLMPYTAEISRRNPSCFLFLIDRSASMEDRFAGDAKRKCDGVADALNKLLYELAIKCAKEEGIRNYYEVGVIGYGMSVGSAFEGALAGRTLVPIAEIAANPIRVEQRTKAGGAASDVVKKIRIPVWFDPVAAGPTPMVQAFELASSYLEAWVEAHPHAYPPAIVNITDGEATDGDPVPAMRKLRQMHTSDGDLLIFNVHLSADAHAKARTFPHSASGLPDANARMLYENSSLLTPFMRTTARQLGFDINDEARGFVSNADLLLVVQALDIGTRASNPLR